MKFLEVDATKGLLLVSNRRSVVKKAVNNVIPVEMVEGTVWDIKPYGALMNLGGVDRWMLVSIIWHDQVGDIGAVVKDSSAMKCMMISHKTRRRVVSTSLQRRLS